MAAEQMAGQQTALRQGFGVDIGGSGIKGAPVDLDKGAMAAERLRVATPQPSTPTAVAAVVGDICRHFNWTGPLGCTFPAVVQNGVARTAANVDKAWIGTDLAVLLGTATGSQVMAMNDADAAGVAEMAFGAGRDQHGVVVLVTLGTGIGSALFVDGRLVPNTELGHLEVGGQDAETRASDAARDHDNLSWKDWAHRLQRYLRTLENLLWPDLIILGGGVSKKATKFVPLMDVRTPLVTAQLLNDAGIVGAAEAATPRPPG
jgi:polyphosphate glucokinase